MNHSADPRELLDWKTSRSICDAVGERLAQALRPDPRLSNRLLHLMDEMRKRERESAFRNM